MRSWIFRHRLRLRAIYGQRPEVRPPVAAPERTPPARVDGLAPGESGQRGAWYVIRPQRPAA